MKPLPLPRPLAVVAKPLPLAVVAKAAVVAATITTTVTTVAAATSFLEQFAVNGSRAKSNCLNSSSFSPSSRCPQLTMSFQVRHRFADSYDLLASLASHYGSGLVFCAVQINSRSERGNGPI